MIRAIRTRGRSPAPDFRAVPSEIRRLRRISPSCATPMWDKAEAETREAFEELVDGARPRSRDGRAFRAVCRSLGHPSHRHDDRDGARPCDWWLARGKPSEVLLRRLVEGRADERGRVSRALDKAARYADSLAEIFRLYGTVVTPAAGGRPRKGSSVTGDSGLQRPLDVDRPAGFVPAVVRGESGLPIGVQLVGGMAGRAGCCARRAR